MKYDFDQVIERRNSGSSKYDYARAAGKPLDLLPFWVADMDFRIPQPVIDAMVERTKHGIFGYGEPREDYLDPIIGWYKKYFDWEPRKEWMVFTPGIVFAVSMAIRTCTKPGEDSFSRTCPIDGEGKSDRAPRRRARGKRFAKRAFTRLGTSARSNLRLLL